LDGAAVVVVDEAARVMAHKSVSASDLVFLIEEPQEVKVVSSDMR
jgi:hypothetical protein